MTYFKEKSHFLPFSTYPRWVIAEKGLVSWGFPWLMKDGVPLYW